MFKNRPFIRGQFSINPGIHHSVSILAFHSIPLFFEAFISINERAVKFRQLFFSRHPYFTPFEKICLIYPMG